MLGNDKYVFILSFFLYAAKLTFFDVFLGLVYFATAQRCMDLTTRCREWVEIRLDIVAMAWFTSSVRLHPKMYLPLAMEISVSREISVDPLICKWIILSSYLIHVLNVI